jgi:general L-amino acid transport system permease protein
MTNVASDSAIGAIVPAPSRTVRRRPPPTQRIAPLRWARKNLFSGVSNSILTLVLAALILLAIWSVVGWAVFDAVWLASSPSECAGKGACWAVIPEKHRFMFFGLYPYDEQWRGFAAILVFVGSIGLSFWRRLWSWRILVPLWIASATIGVMLVRGGVFGLKLVETGQWGGIPLTLMVFGWTVGVGLPLGILLALARRSRLPFIRIASITLIEAVRGVPLVAVLFYAAVVFPLSMPEGWSMDKLVRILIAMSVFYGCYFAEVVRGGLQAIPKGQYEAGRSLGLSYWTLTRKVVLPQALRLVIPGLMNHIISAFKNSTFVVVVGLFDLFNATTAALADPLWIRYYTEAYLFVALFYFLGAHVLSRFGTYLERELSFGRQY